MTTMLSSFKATGSSRRNDFGRKFMAKRTATTLVLVALVCCSVFGVIQANDPQHGVQQDVKAVYDLLHRVIKVRLSKWSFAVVPRHECAGYCIDATPTPTPTTIDYDDESNEAVTRVHIRGATISDLTAGLGFYLRSANITIGWPAGGGSSLVLPTQWPVMNNVRRQRRVPHSSLMNVCTHSYSLVWYDQEDWEQFIDWMALTGINNILALTGQEYLQYQIFTSLGVADVDVRTWFNGPAFLTWSRGQNEYGNNIAGPLPMSWMQQQYQLQKRFILPRLRALGIVGQLPAFQGNVPIQIKHIFQDANITQQGATGWMDSLDPLYSKIAKLWMETFIGHFGTDHWYQLDGYFNGGTAPWRHEGIMPKHHFSAQTPPSLGDIAHDQTWYQRGLAAFRGLSAVDPKAIWSFQGFSFVGWDTPEQASYLKGFIDAAGDRFVIIDMSYALGQWTQWNNSTLFGSRYIWTKLHNFGGTDGLKGNLRVVNQMPFVAKGNIIGIGATPEGINQNALYYEFLYSQAYREAPVANLTEHIVKLQHGRYQLVDYNEDVAQAWALLLSSAYATDGRVQDMTGVAHIQPRGGDGDSYFERNRYQPNPIMCKIVHAWKHMLKAAQDFDGTLNEPFRYDLVNLGREVLAQISTPLALNFTEAIHRNILNRQEIESTATKYMNLLRDLDELVATDTAFLLGPWLASARRWGKDNSMDCVAPKSHNCGDFYEWNARCQITTWNPTLPDSPQIPGGPIDYAAKHWSGLIQDYYVKRIHVVMRQTLDDASRGNSLNQTQLDRLLAQHAYQWTTSVNIYPTSTTGDAVTVSLEMYDTYKDMFQSCTISRGTLTTLSLDRAQ